MIDIWLNLKEVNEDIALYETIILDAMSVEGVQSLRTTDGFNIISVTTMHPNITNREAAYVWLKELGAYEDMATINTNTFKAFIKNKMEMGEAIPDDCIEIYYKNSLTMRRG